MHKRRLYLAVTAVLVFGAAGTAAFILTRSEKAQTPEPVTTQSLLTSNSYAEARLSPTNGVGCLIEDESIVIPADERTDIEYTSMAHLYDVPAGTYVDVPIASYSGEKVAGSNLYEGDYGSYNFVLSRQDGDWIVTEYKRCEL